MEGSSSFETSDPFGVGAEGADGNGGHDPEAVVDGEEEYVEREVEITRLQFTDPRFRYKSGVDNEVQLQERLERSEEYARSRWQGYHSMDERGRRVIVSL